MKIQAVKTKTEPLSAQINKVYLESFPQSERKPIDTLYSHQETGYCDVLAILEDDGRFIGMITTVKRPQLILVEYLAIASEYQGSGYGSKVLNLLQENYPDHTICLEIEDTHNTGADNYPQRMSRLDFYLANGFQQLNWVVNFYGVPLEVLANRPDLEFDDYIQLYTQIHGDGTHDNIYFLEDRRS